MVAMECPPAPSGTPVRISVVERSKDVKTSALRVCGHLLARGTARGDYKFTGMRVGQASAAGHRVAWIEERHRGGERVTTVSVARVGRDVRVLRRFVVQRVRTRYPAQLGVVLTRQGDLAWMSGSYDDDKGVIAVKQPGKPVRTLASNSAYRLMLEDGTLRWDEEYTSGFFDLRKRDCREGRARYKPYAANDRVRLTRGIYGSSDEGLSVIRGCDLATGRDRVLLQNYATFSYTSDLQLVGIDRTWAVFTQVQYDPRDADSWIGALTVADAAGDRTFTASYHGSSAGTFPPPRSAVVTDLGVAGWIAETVLYGLVRGKIVRLDEGATLEGLHAEGDALVWTHNGEPRRLVP